MATVEPISALSKEAAGRLIGAMDMIPKLEFSN